MDAHVVGTVVLGLAASLCWGSSDFSGGLASRRATVASVVVANYTVGLVLLAAAALIGHEPFPKPLDVLWGGLAGLAGTIGLLAFYTALSSGRMGLAAPLSAVLTAALPVLFGALTGGWPAPPQLAGFAVAGIALVLITGGERARGSARAMRLAVLAGVGFGCFFILISRVAAADALWSLAVARFFSLAMLVPWVRMQQQPLLPARPVTPLVVLAGVLDALGNACFVLAAHMGRLDVAAVLASLYPAATVGLSVVVLRERVRRPQALGILLVLLAVPLISA